MESNKLSYYLIKYLHTLKLSEKNEVYETILLMMLNDSFLASLNKITRDNLKKVKLINNKISFEVHSSKEYEDAIDLVCKSKYFIENFTQSEIVRKKIIAKNIIVEIALQSVMEIIQKDITANVNFCKVIYPAIDHKILNNKTIPQIQLTFNEGTPLDDIVRYLKEVLEIKNNPKKRKMSLGQSFRMMQISNEIKNKTLDYTKQKYEYNEQIIAREMFNRYKEKVTMEAVTKSLQRIKKIKKDINTNMDK